MKVRNNSASVNVLRRFGMNQTEMQKDLEKLSSGFKINKAGDDAAGLAVSESMRDRIRGLEQGHYNIDDGMSLINTAEGGMQEITNMLQRMSKLSVQAMNDTYNKSNREELQLEIDQLKEEITRIADNTEFNDIKILKINSDDTLVQYEKTGLPSWMSTKGLTLNDFDEDGHPTYNQEMKVGNISSSYTQDTGDAGHTMKKLTGINESGKFTYDYYGPSGTCPENDEYCVYTDKGEFSSTLSDNLGAVISFKGLCDKYDPASSDYTPRSAKELYNDVYELLGSSLGVSCATCNDSEVINKHYYGFAFYGTARDLDSGKVREYLLDGMSYADSNGNAVYPVTGNALDISEIYCPDDDGIPLFDYLTYKIRQNPDPEELSEAATMVAQRLYDKTYEKLKTYISTENHFNDACEIDKGSNSMTFAIFDCRDAALLDTKEVKLQKNTTGNYLIHPDPMWIQCSNAEDDRVPINLPYVDISRLDLDSYDVSRYTTVTREIYDPDDIKREAAERADPDNWITTTTTDTVIIPAHQEPIYKDLPNEYGETVKKLVGYEDVEEQTYEHTSTETNYTGFTAEPIGTEKVEVYVPDDMTKITDAIDKISAFRAKIGVQYNRLEHTKSNNEVMDENVTASESRIRDTDMASAMSKFQKNSLLMKASETMLGIADDSTRGILDLLG